MKAIIPAVHNRWHEALDELEIEVLKAKTVFEQDRLDVRNRNKREKELVIAEEERREEVLEEGVLEESGAQELDEREEKGESEAGVVEESAPQPSELGKRKRDGKQNAEGEQAGIGQAEGGNRGRMDEGYALGVSGASG